MMFQGLKKAFSKGHSSGVETLEASTALRDETIPVRPKLKPEVASSDLSSTDGSNSNGFAPSSSDLHSSLTGAGGQEAWAAKSLGQANTPLRGRSGATVLSAAPPLSTAGTNSLSASATTGSSQPPSAATTTAWAGTSTLLAKDASRSTSEKDAPKPAASKLSGLFRSGSKNARNAPNAPAEEATAVEPVGQCLGGSDDSFHKECTDDVRRCAESRNSQKAQALTQKAEREDDDGPPSAVRRAVMRTGSLMATPR
ncbi:hypothetical protein Vretimale_10041 [Volvox reticuliferus]|uniref:Uncharacterized protein n=1 Tax=Volvox reticuliferus TaxID=1737510 RepID=A0A8J4BYZ8_9CHLO|nr:hypothetical protein Vretifemale_804 [Volvox reticuliferus]GIM05579.1 hypothetical protein Vretimale_10041 [Volvox reticuliferus]